MPRTASVKTEKTVSNDTRKQIKDMIQTVCETKLDVEEALRAEHERHLRARNEILLPSRRLATLFMETFENSNIPVPPAFKDDPSIAENLRIRGHNAVPAKEGEMSAYDKAKARLPKDVEYPQYGLVSTFYDDPENVVQSAKEPSAAGVDLWSDEDAESEDE